MGPTSGISGNGFKAYIACQPICQRGLQDLLSALEFEVVAVSDGDHDVVPGIRRSGARFALLDIGRTGVRMDHVLAGLNGREPGVRLVFGTHSDAGTDLFRAIEGGAAGFVALDAPLDELRRDLERARIGTTAVSARFGRVMIDEIRERGDHAGDQPLSPRQTAVLQLVADGASTDEIAQGLSISPLTVKSHYSAINQKLEVSSKAAAVAEAFRRGIVA